MVQPISSAKDRAERPGAAGQTTKVNQPTGIRVLCVDDHPLLREGIGTVINNQPDMLVVGEASNAQQAIEQFAKLRPDVTLMDLPFPTGVVSTPWSLSA